MTDVVMADRFRLIARVGYAARGVVYLIIGGLAMLAALGRGGDTTNSRGALMEVMSQPFGKVLLLVLIIGLFSYAGWRATQSIRDADSHGRSGTGLLVRIGLFASAVTHALLACWAIGLLAGISPGQDGSMMSAFLGSAAGQIILALGAVAVLGVGLAHIYKGLTAGFEKYLEIPAAQDYWAQPVCRFGLISRGVVWCMVSWFLINSALRVRSGEISGMADALAALQENTYGPWLLGLAAAGLFAFGLYSLLEAVYRRIGVGLAQN